jgi:hypothetical protein
MQRAREHRERMKTEHKPLLKGQRDKVYRNVRMSNMLKRFVAEDDQLYIAPDQSEKDKELCDELARIKMKYQVGRPCKVLATRRLGTPTFHVRLSV